MENLHDWINSGILAVLAVFYFLQQQNVKYMKSAMDAIDPEKIKSAQDIIDKGKEYEMKIKLTSEIDKITKQTAKRFQETNKDFLGMFNELLTVPFGILKDHDWQYREKYLAHLPKCSDTLRALLEAYDKGDFPPKNGEPDKSS